MKQWIIMAATALAGLGAVPAAAQWKPDRPINLIVPWAPGGATDQVTRLAASEMEAALGQKIVVVNQPGASGSIGTKNALDAPKDGYTWTAGAVQDLGVYKVLGMAPTDLGDWNLYLSVANVPVISVNPQTPYQNLGDLLKAMKDKPKTVTISTGGVASASHNAAEAHNASGRGRVSARDLRRRQPGGGGRRRGGGERHDPARGRTGGDDPRQAAPSAGGLFGAAARALGLRHHPVRDRDPVGSEAADQLLRHLRP
jgi:hypothetical protein